MVEYFLFNNKPFRITGSTEQLIVETICSETGKRVINEEISASKLRREGEKLSFDQFVQKVEEIRQPIFAKPGSDVAAVFYDPESSELEVSHTINVFMLETAKKEGRELTLLQKYFIEEQRKQSYALFENTAATKEAADLMRKDLKKRSEE